MLQSMTASQITLNILLLLAAFLNSACTRTQTSVNNPAAEPQLDAARKLVQEKTCTTCHSLNGQPGVGPTFMYLYGKKEKLTDGTEVLVDEAYLRESIQNPAAKIVANHTPTMPVVPLTEPELNQIIALIKSMGK